MIKELLPSLAQLCDSICRGGAVSDSSSLGHRVVFLHAIQGTDSQVPSIKHWLRKYAHGGQSETGLGPGTLQQHRSACTWTQLSLSNKTHRNYTGLKITVCMRHWGKFRTKKTKKEKKNPTAISEEPRAKMECWKQM